MNAGEKAEPQVLDDDWTDGARALCTAARLGDVHRLMDLLPQVPDAMDRFRALWTASYHGQLAVVQHLVHQVDPKWQDSYPLREAIEGGHVEVVEFLLPLSEPDDPEGLTLEWALPHPVILEKIWPHVNPERALARLKLNRNWEAIDRILVRWSSEEAQVWRALHAPDQAFPRTQAQARAQVLAEIEKTRRSSPHGRVRA